MFKWLWIHFKKHWSSIKVLNFLRAPSGNCRSRVFRVKHSANSKTSFQLTQNHEILQRFGKFSEYNFQVFISATRWFAANQQFCIFLFHFSSILRDTLSNNSNSTRAQWKWALLSHETPTATDFSFRLFHPFPPDDAFECRVVDTETAFAFAERRALFN